MRHRTNGSDAKVVRPLPPKTRRVLVVASAGTQILDFVGPFQVFVRGMEVVARSNPSAAPAYSVEGVSTEKGLISTSSGLSVKGHWYYRDVRGPVDTLLIAGGNAVENDLKDEDVLGWLRKMAKSVRRLGSICTGAFLLGAAGLLDGRRATTHWRYCDAFQRRYPKVMLDPDPIFVRDGNVYTSAGVTAGMDMALAMVEEDLGSAVALQVARELVLYLRRPGGQSQFSAALSLQAQEKQPFRDLGPWVLENLAKDLSVEKLARRMGMSPRNFARVFREEMETTPAKYVQTLRVEAARRRLQESNTGLKAIAASCGFRNPDGLRSTFKRVLGVSPGEYRERFRGDI
ncbi:MAG TPA: GlxA family transcriptional regulator [Terriglobales bacterium]|nr:GlxA family transcriptional regulator [Terriglobales bacterium]